MSTIKLHRRIKEIVAMVLFLNGSFAFAQLPSKNIIPLSPNTAQLGIFGTVPVGLFTGTVQQSIPIYEFKTHNLSLPITLSYSSNGLVVDKVASWVGFDWSLDAGGAITCNVKGRPDNLYPRSDVPEGIESDLTNFRNYLESHFTGDQQPDIFSFNFGGSAGKFFLNYNGKQAYTIPYQKLKIETTRSDGDMTKGKDFIITTPDGVKYIFDKVEQYIGITESYPTSWYLSTIIHPAGDVINFYYTQPALATYYPGVSQTISRFLYASGNATPPSDPPDNPTSQSVNNMSFFLDSIKSTGYGTVIFQKTSNRTDYYNGQRLDRIIIKNSQNQTIKNAKLEYQYVVNSLNYPMGSGINFTGSTGSNPYIQNELKYRMFLDAVYFNDSQNQIVQSYKFSYLNLDNLPSRLSFAQDHWGFFNGANNNYLIPASAIPSGYEGKFPTGIYCNREANSQYSQNGLLSKVTYPTGGYSIFEYESHNNGSQDIGGVRIKRVTTYENASSVPVVKRYYYPNCYGRGIPSYYYAFKTYTGVNSSYVTNYHGAIVSSSLYSIYNSDQGSAVYPTVRVSFGENYEGGGELHSFDVTTDVPALSVNYMGGSSLVPVPYSNVAWYNGTKRSETLFKKNSSGQFVNVKSVSYNFDRTDSRYNTDYNAMAIVKNPPPPNQEIGRDVLQDYTVFKYRVYSTWNKPSSTIETVYDDSGNTVVSSTTYSYDDLNKGHSQLSREIVTKSNGDIITKKYFYPGDYNGVTFLTNPFMIGKVLESRAYVNSKLTQFEQFQYNSQGQVSQYFKSDLGNSGTDIPFNPDLNYTAPLKITFNYSNSNLVGVNPVDNFKTAYLWGYNQTYPIAKAINATPDQLAYTSFEDANEKGRWEFTYNPSNTCNSTCTSAATSAATQAYNSCISTCNSSCGGNQSCLSACTSSCQSAYDGTYAQVYNSCMSSCQASNPAPIVVGSAKTGGQYFQGSSVSISNLPLGNYKVGCWIKKTGSSDGTVSVNGASNTISASTWQYKEFSVNSATSVTLSLTGVGIDELRLCPQGAQMTTYTYKPLVGMTSAADENGQVTYYEYDSFGRLKTIKDSAGNILKSYDYHYKQ